MKPKKHQAKKRLNLLWIMIGVIVLLAAGFGLYAQMGLKRQRPIAMQAVVRLKIPSTMDTPTMTSPEKSSIQPENTQGDSEAAVASDNSPEGISSPAVNGAPDVRQMDAEQTTAFEAPHQIPAQQVPADPGTGSGATQNPTRQADAEQSTPFAIQVGAYLTKTYADRTVSQLMEKGYDAYIIQRIDKKQRLWYLVRFGHFQDRVAASQVLTTFKDQEHMEASLAITN